ncbi:hypothetical protein MSMTP_0922 [Methanosarcina sp. MTP4]|uniref:hypothetical protein n=1 Tax=Methanosarcina sp. MTP4 TaxID=1434100 RepID=UPI000615943C|nr:hypothetical protein [Methanosarcina sp. MTP4]AKB24391.1 hypothetical protein MSMTP_0922 [Methanosarcina sp. MTP4]
MKSLFSDTRAADTIPLKLVVYLGLLAAVLLLIAQAWENASPVLDEAEIEAQVEDAALSLLSIQKGHARPLEDRYGPEGGMCVLTLSLPEQVRYLSFGADPDPDCSGNLSDSEWKLENNTLIYQYKNGVKQRVLLGGETVHFLKGASEEEGNWIPAVSPENNETSPGLKEIGIVIEYPVSGEFVFELVSEDGVRYTMSHF